jgi:hypothetical protein
VQCNKKTIWQQIEINTPSDWEMLRYGQRMEFGNSTFSDMYKEWLQVSWQKNTDCPEMERFVSDVKSKYIVENEDEEKEPQFFEPVKKLSGWFGVIVLIKGEYTAHLVKYFKKSNTLIELTLLHGEIRHESLERELCSKIKLSSPHEGMQTWRTFEQRYDIPENFHVEKTTINPGDIELSYTSSILKGKKRHYPYVSIHSCAFPEFVLNKQSMKEWLKEKLPKYTKITKEYGGHTPSGDEFYKIVSLRRRGHILFLFGAKYYREDNVILSNTKQRLYHTISENEKSDVLPNIVMQNS